jgi:hypothetical protein
MTMANATSLPLFWRVRRRFWNFVATGKFRKNMPAQIPLPRAGLPRLEAVPIAARYPAIPISKVLVAGSIPPDEFSRWKRLFYRVQVWLYRAFSPMRPGLPEIAADLDEALRQAYTPAHAKLFPPPRLPESYRGEGKPELGELAVASPFACFLEKTSEGKLVWDLRYLGRFDLQPGLSPVGAYVEFKLDEKSRALVAQAIETASGSFRPGDPGWDLARRTALAAASTATSMVRHFNWVHLCCGGPLAIATRNELPHDHPICRMIWPHMYHTQYSNDLVTMGQLAPAAEFEAIFSFTHRGLCQLFDDTWPLYRISVIDPAGDWTVRGLAGTDVARPVQENLEELFDLFLRHAARYVNAYYSGDAAVRADPAIGRWLEALDRLIPNGIAAVAGEKPGREGLARLLAAFIYLATVQHEALGTGLWNYQLWTGIHPSRIYADGRRERIDVYQRLVNANFNLNVNRAQLMRDYSHLALDAKGVELFGMFQSDLRKLQAKYEKEPFDFWRIYPAILEVNINA